MKVLVTGSSGYIGGALIDDLRRARHVIVGLDRRAPTGAEPDTFVLGDLRDPDRVDLALRGVERVYHLAAAKGDWGLSDDEYEQDNRVATEVLVDRGRAADVGEWVVMSTVGVYGPSDAALDERAECVPVTTYGRTKLAAERSCASLAADPDVAVAVLRPSAVFGPGHPPSTNVHRLVEALRTNRFVMIGDGRIAKSTSQLDNLLAAVGFVADRLTPGLVVRNMVDTPIWQTGRLVEAVCDALGRPRPRFTMPLTLARRASRVADGVATLTRVDLPITSARIQKFCTATDYDASALAGDGFVAPVDLDVAVRDTVAWHVDRFGPWAPMR